MTWIDRYLGSVLRDIPASKRADVERELRSSITDAIDERVGAGEDAVSAERAVLEDLGDPAELAAGYSGRPTYLISPELFPIWRQFLIRVLVVAVPASAAIIGALAAVGNGAGVGAIGAAIAGALNVAVQTTFWMTAFFVFLDWAGSARQARAELLAARGRWTVDRLPRVAEGRISLGEAAGEIVTIVITLAILLFAATLSTTTPAGVQVPLFATPFMTVWLPTLVVAIVMRGIVHLRAYNTGQWTRWLAVYHALLQLSFGTLVVVLAVTGWIVNPAFGEAIGYPDLASGDGPVMLTFALFTAIATGYEIVRIFIRARRPDRASPPLGVSAQTV
jgi:HAAS domain-containing protein